MTQDTPNMPSLALEARTRQSAPGVFQATRSSQQVAVIQQVNQAIRSVLRESVHRDLCEKEIFAGRLLSLRLAQALAADVSEVCVSSDTVITPLARDFLKQHRISLRIVSRLAVEPLRGRGEWGFAIDARSGPIDAIRRAWLDESEPWTELASGLDAAARWVIERPGRGVVFLTDEASVAVWRACRIDGVRAATAGEPEAVARAIRRLGINLLVVEPAGKPIFLIRQLGLTFRKAGAPHLPDEDLEGLG